MEHLVWRRVTIPKGLSNLLELICTETLRQNPDCIHSFIADLLEKEYDAEVERQQRRNEEERRLIEQPDEVTPVSVIHISDEKPPSPPASENPAILSVSAGENVSAKVDESEPVKTTSVKPESPPAAATEVKSISPPAADVKPWLPPVVEVKPLTSAPADISPSSQPVASDVPVKPPSPSDVDITSPIPPIEVKPQTPPVSDSNPSSPTAEEIKSQPVEVEALSSPSPQADEIHPAPASENDKPETLLPLEVKSLYVSEIESLPVKVASVPPSATDVDIVSLPVIESKSLPAVEEINQSQSPVPSSPPLVPSESPPVPKKRVTLSTAELPRSTSSDDKPVSLSTTDPSQSPTLDEPLVAAAPVETEQKSDSPNLDKFIEESSKPELGLTSRLSVQEREEIEQLLEHTLDAKEIQELLESGDFLAESDTKQDDPIRSDTPEKAEDDEISVVKPEELFQSQAGEAEYDDDEDEDEVDSGDSDDDDEEEDADDSEVGILRNSRAVAAGELSSSDMEANEAATRIQANFRGYRARKNLEAAKKQKQAVFRSLPEGGMAASDSSPDRSSVDTPPEPVARRRVGSSRIRSLGKYRSGVVMDTQQDDEALLNLEGDYLDKAATRIQANVRGFLTRKEYQKQLEANKSKKVAATKIQATVRGFLARRRLQRAKVANRRRSSHGNTLKIQRRGSLKPDQAATKIQAAFRGYHVRRSRSKNPSESAVEKIREPPASPPPAEESTPVTTMPDAVENVNSSAVAPTPTPTPESTVITGETTGAE